MVSHCVSLIITDVEHFFICLFSLVQIFFLSLIGCFLALEF